jgi:thiol-disulfide isomerase/thioredoxin
MSLRVAPIRLRQFRVLALSVFVTACHSLQVGAPPAPRGANFAVLINGGGRPSINFQSHLTHVRGFVGVLERYGIPRGNVVIFSGDGADPAADLATRESVEDEDFWFLTRRAQQVLRPQIEYVDSVVEGYELRPAKREAIELWLLENSKRFKRGDTLFFYVTDHGEINKDDMTDNTIVLWKEMMSVRELREMFGRLPTGLRTVMLMSQCFSGSFASLADPARDVCGYFASSADRPAYGCYPENRGVDAVGHSHHFLRGIDRLGTLDRAHEHVLVADDSPDVPHASSDVYLRRLLEIHAGERDFAEVVDEQLDIAWKHRGRWESDIRLLDRIGQAYGIFSPRSLQELQQQAKALPAVSDQLSTYAERWDEVLDAVRQENLNDFLEEHPEWKEKLAPEALKEATPDQRTALATELLQNLAPFTRSQESRLARMELLRQRADDAAAAAYRMEVRLGVVLRMYNQLTNVAGRVYLEESGDARQRAEYAALRDCESLELARVGGERRWWWPFATEAKRAEDLDAPDPFPRIDDDRQLVDKVMPAWMGIRYRPPTPEEQKTAGRSPGAVTVMTVYPESAAGKAGLTVGDIILGPPDAPFVEANQVREWTMQREIGEPAPLRVQRGDETMELTLLPDPFPIEMPELPGPPKLGSPAPAFELEPYRGEATVRAGTSSLLFFWATWCTPCKFALPEVMRIGRERNIPVIAITDEKAETLNAFFAEFDGAFPHRVAIDPYRTAFQAFGVSGTPTFVLVDGDGIVRYYETGFNAQVGLSLP